MTYRPTDEEIEALAGILDQRMLQKPVPAPETAMKYRYEHEPDEDCRKAAQALRQLLAENRRLRERLEPCRHEEVEKAGTDWWRCTLCDTYIDTAALDAREGA